MIVGVDYDSTLSAIPGVLGPIIKAMRKGGITVWVVTGNPAVDDDVLAKINVTVDAIHCVDPGKNGIGKAKFCKANHVDLLIDNNVSFAKTVPNACSLLLLAPSPVGAKWSKDIGEAPFDVSKI